MADDNPGSERRPRAWQPGQPCQLRAPDMREPIDAIVVLASPNGRSLIVAFDALVHGHAGMMPLYSEAAAKAQGQPSDVPSVGDLLRAVTGKSK